MKCIAPIANLKISGNSTVISYHDFCNPACTRNFDVTGIGQLTGTYNSDDYPDINGQSVFVYTAGGSVFRALVSAPTNPVMIAAGSNPRVADGFPTPEIVYIANGQVLR